LEAADTPSGFSATLESLFPPLPQAEELRGDDSLPRDEKADDEIGALMATLTGLSESNTAALRRLQARLVNAMDAEAAAALIRSAVVAFDEFDQEVDRVLGCALDAAVGNAQCVGSPSPLVAELRRSVAEAVATQQASWQWLESRVARLRMKRRYPSS